MLSQDPGRGSAIQSMPPPPPPPCPTAWRKVTHAGKESRSLINQQPQPSSASMLEPAEPETRLQEGTKVQRAVKSPEPPTELQSQDEKPGPCPAQGLPTDHHSP